MEWNLIYKIFGLLFFSELAYFKVADRLNIIDKPNKRSSHERITLLGGGVVFILVYFCIASGSMCLITGTLQD